MALLVVEVPSPLRLIKDLHRENSMGGGTEPRHRPAGMKKRNRLVSDASAVLLSSSSASILDSEPARKTSGSPSEPVVTLFTSFEDSFHPDIIPGLVDLVNSVQYVIARPEYFSDTTYGVMYEVYGV